MKILKIKTKRREIGNIGERAACKFLKKQGYKILKKNYVIDGNEIDIIAECREDVAFIEVKTRSTESFCEKEARPASAVTPEKQAKIIKCARLYKKYNYFEKRMRLDIIEVYLTEGKVSKINHMPSAFTINESNKHYQKTTKNNW